MFRRISALSRYWIVFAALSPFAVAAGLAMAIAASQFEVGPLTLAVISVPSLYALMQWKARLRKSRRGGHLGR